ncbi:hypothetical protein ACSVDA_24160 [Cytobacillus sp. Hm23]
MRDLLRKADQKGIITQRAIRVMDVGKETVVVYCFLRNRKRSFRLDNILLATVKADR